MLVYCCVGVLSCWCIVLLVYCCVGVLSCWCTVVLWCIVILVYCRVGILSCWFIVVLIYCSRGGDHKNVIFLNGLKIESEHSNLL